MKAEKIIRKQRGITTLKDQNEGLIVNFSTDAVYGLNALACYIWEKCDGKTREEILEEAKAKLAGRWSLECENAVNNFIASLVSSRMIEVG